MATLLFLLLSLSTSLLPNPTASSSDSFISATISTKGLTFAKDLLISQAIESFVPIRLPDIRKSVEISLLGEVNMVASDVIIESVNVSSSTIAAGESGIVIVASGASAKVSLSWSYEYSSWFVAFSDEGTASVQVEGMEIGLTMGMKNQEGTLELSVTECGCYITELDITMNGGASWFYQGFIDAFGNHITSSVESAITDKITEGTRKLDSLLQNLPKEIKLDNIASMNVTFVNDPLFKISSVEFDINGLVVLSDSVASDTSYLLCTDSQIFKNLADSSKMLWISLDEAVFNSGSDVFFQAGLMNWMVDKLPDQFFLRTDTWRFIIPQLYKKYPNEDMVLNISLISPPILNMLVGKIGATVYSDITVNVLDADKLVPVACISVVASVSGNVEVKGNNIAGKAELDDFSLTLKWSEVGNFHMSLVQSVIKLFLKRVCVPYINSHLEKGFPLPIIHGFYLKDAYIFTSNSKIIIGSDVVFNESIGSMQSSMPQIRNLFTSQRSFI